MEKVREALEAALEMRQYLAEALTSNSYEDAPSIRSCWFEVEAIERMIKDALAALPSCEGWRGIESAPRDGTYILAYPALLQIPLVITWKREKGWLGSWRMPMTDSPPPYVPTHWMPLPSPPERKET